MHRPLVIAHRGDPSSSPENSLAAVRSALSIPVDMIEVDIRRGKDSSLFVMHDRTTGRTADRNIDLERSSEDQIRGIRLVNGEPVPSLENLLDAVHGSCGLNLEIKSSGAGILTARSVRSAGYSGPVLLSSFKEQEIIAARKENPGLSFALIFDVFAVRNIPDYRARGYSIISLRKETVTRKLVEACHEQGVQLFVWTVDDENDMRRFIGEGVDGLYSNRPLVLKKMLDEVKSGDHQ